MKTFSGGIGARFTRKSTTNNNTQKSTENQTIKVKSDFFFTHFLKNFLKRMKIKFNSQKI
jgi:hypothetical protein